MVDVIIHCSSSRYGNAALIAKWHLERGFDTIGYHFVILNGQLDSRHYFDLMDGQIESGRPLDDDHIFEVGETGAHVRGHNQSVGICLIGESGNFTHRQIECLSWVLGILDRQFQGISIYQHSDFDKAKSFCAGLSDVQMTDLRQLVG